MAILEGSILANSRIQANLALHDFEPKTTTFYAEVIAGLQREDKNLPCKFFYDERGSKLFDAICELDEYYPTRTETAIMRDNIDEMLTLLGPDCRLVEYGSGSSTKTRILLDHATDLTVYVPVDISRSHLLHTARLLSCDYPHLEVTPVCADYTEHFTLPAPASHVSRTVVYFPGSTIGNFHPKHAQYFLAQIAELCGEGGGLLIGVDLKKDTKLLNAAYNDRRGVTADFNLNLLTRINRELGADFNLGQFRHNAYYNADLGRIEMHIESLADQRVRIGDESIAFAKGETIHTECSYKYSLRDFENLAAAAGFVVNTVWTDPNELFSVQYLTVAG
jgi:dimethylhistidine N-methyltransferase